MANSLHGTMGVVFVGAICDAILYGIVIFQTYRYFGGRNDGLGMRVLVSLLCLLDTLQLILIGHALYYFLISHFSDAIVLQRSVWSLNLEVAVTVVITFIVRCFFTVRLWTMSNKNIILAAAISIFSLAQLGLGIGMSVITLSI
ncbi:hypothetical protein PILCRDRAFT_199093 [Piloderma croceum F 1598]|uniref:Uncharacterized protein n=1 Tax=Piloderma croceum (strain F 1598) TaxID=765440 RepID=A0A0C3BTG1_PILCF|nr:hypothetical protein PILCRDRAFT_199093 [Piloderma croceum F 1598]